MLELSQANDDITNKLRNVLTNFAIPNNSTLLQVGRRRPMCIVVVVVSTVAMFLGCKGPFHHF